MNGGVVRTNSFRDHTSGGDRLAPAVLDQVVSSAGYKRELSLGLLTLVLDAGKAFHASGPVGVSISTEKQDDVALSEVDNV